jgi:ABC-2 type transport system ATP-binding protein
MIETTELTKDFRGRRAVDGLNLNVREGDVYGFLGPNGAGKSTTIRMLTGLVAPTKGTARLMGIDVVNRSVDALREVGALVETPAFYKYLTARQNLRLFSTLSGGCPEKRIDEVLDTRSEERRVGKECAC